MLMSLLFIYFCAVEVCVCVFGSAFLHTDVAMEDYFVNEAVFLYPLVESNNNHRAVNAPCSSG